MVDAELSLVAAYRSAEGQTTFHYVRQVEPSEQQQLLDATVLLGQVTVHSPYAALNASYDALAAAVQEVEDALPTQDAALLHRLLAAMPLRLNDLLSAFRSFTDQTDRWAKQFFGEASSERAKIKAQTASEYDSRFGYALATNLRNVSQHRRSVMRMTTYSRETPSGSEHWLDMMMDDAAIDDRWQKPVLNALRQHPRPIPMAPVLDDMILGCERIEARALVLAEEKIRPAADLISRVVDEARASAAIPDAAVAIAANLKEVAAGGHAKLELKPLRDEYVRIWEQALPGSRTVLARAAKTPWPKQLTA